MMPRKILVIEDNDRNRKLIKILLEANKYSVIEAQTGEEALKYLQDDKPDLILLDIQLPKMDGLTLVKKLRLDQKMKDIPIVAVTAYAMKGDKERMLEAGCDAYVSKPIDTRELPVIVANLINIRMDK
ncbi:MAG: two-component system, cell cycle response regulator DivK [Candidatus Poribacteria bacterium]|nr:two-component system, cell cycle response regulator DivK [Candidatus Poribacteria bacterium]